MKLKQLKFIITQFFQSLLSLKTISLDLSSLKNPYNLQKNKLLTFLNSQNDWYYFKRSFKSDFAYLCLTSISFYVFIYMVVDHN